MNNALSALQNRFNSLYILKQPLVQVMDPIGYQWDLKFLILTKIKHISNKEKWLSHLHEIQRATFLNLFSMHR